MYLNKEQIQKIAQIVLEQCRRKHATTELKLPASGAGTAPQFTTTLKPGAGKSQGIFAQKPATKTSAAKTAPSLGHDVISISQTTREGKPWVRGNEGQPKNRPGAGLSGGGADNVTGSSQT